jgi:transcription antitermination factor NusG
MPDQFWAVVRVAGQRESFAAEQLQARGFETFLPKIETRRTVQPLFASYVFCIVREGKWLAITTCFGVHSVIRFGDMPARCPDHEIEALRRRADPITGIIRLPPAPPPRAFKRGARVRIIAGPFASFDAIHTGMTKKARELVLIDVLGGRREVEVASHLVEAQTLRPGGPPGGAAPMRRR